MAHLILIDQALPSVVYTDNEMQSATTTTHTFTAKSIGAAKATRTVLVMWFQGSTATSLSMTINGNAATEVVNADVGTGRRFRVFALNVPTGTTATIVTTANAGGKSFIAVYAAYDLLSTTPTDSNSGVTAGASLSLDLNVAANGIAIGYGSTTVTSTYTWTGLVKQFEASQASPAESQSGAIYTATAAQSPLAVTVSRPTSGVYGFTASFR